MIAALVTALSMVAFAANSLLCRAALGARLIDPVTFTSVRLGGGAMMLVVVSQFAGEAAARPREASSWASGVALFVYAAAFSLAYLSLDTGMGALILFGAVQATMIGVGLKAGERPHPAEWLGLVVALGGLVYLVSPGITAPNPLGAALMSLSGAAWGTYSLRGKGASAPVAATTGNFLRAVPLTVVASAGAFSLIDARGSGLVLALASGTVTSGVGYVVWYVALRSLTATRAAIVQLVVPVIAALGGVAVLGERLTLRLTIACALILGGVALAVLSRAPPTTPGLQTK